MRRAARLAAAGCVVALPLLAASAPPAGATVAGRGLALPAATTQSGQIPLPLAFRNIDPLNCVTVPLRKDRCRKSSVPGAVDDTEAITVAVGPAGDPEAVTDRQRLVVHGKGPYLIYELGPARAVEGLTDLSLPTNPLGQVVWQGFSAGTRPLDGLLTLDAGIEAARLPMAVRLQFVDGSGGQRALGAAGTAPTDGTATVTLVNQTATPRFLSVGTADAVPLARSLDLLLAAATAANETGEPAVPPFAGAGLPRSLPGSLAGTTQATVTAALRIRGQLTVAGSTGNPVSGPGTTAVTGGATVAGLLARSVSFRVEMRQGQRLTMALDVQPTVDARTLKPPGDAASWTAWARSRPDAAARTDATATFVTAAAAAARAADYSPYLQTDTNGRSVSSFRYVVAATATRRADAVLTAKPGAIVAACLAGVAIVGNAALLRRRW